MRRLSHHQVTGKGRGTSCLCAGLLALLGCCSLACGQTNPVPAGPERFAAPELELRPLDTDLNLKPPLPLELVHTELPAPTNHLNGNLSPLVHQGRERDLDQELLERLEQAGYFDPPPPPPDSPVLRWADATFRPEEIRFGKKAKGSCSIYTAIKRKNPLCLLNSIFLNVSW